MAVRPSKWDPKNPTPHVCIYCYERADEVFLWKYGINYACFNGKCLRNAKRSVGYVGFFPHVAAAKSKQAEIAADKADKATKGAQRGKGRGVDDRTAGVRSKDYTR